MIHTMSFGYNAAGQLDTASDPAASFTYQFDTLGRPEVITHNLTSLGKTITMSHTYNKEGHRTQLVGAIDSVDDFVTDYGYTDIYQVDWITQTSPTGAPNTVADKYIDFSYSTGLPTELASLTRYADLPATPGTAATQEVATSTYSFDSTGRLTDLSHADAASTLLADYDWTFDDANRVTQFVSLTDGTADYMYDSTDQVTDATYTYQANESVTFDANGTE